MRTVGAVRRSANKIQYLINPKTNQYILDDAVHISGDGEPQDRHPETPDVSKWLI